MPTTATLSTNGATSCFTCGATVATGTIKQRCDQEKTADGAGFKCGGPFGCGMGWNEFSPGVFTIDRHNDGCRLDTLLTGLGYDEAAREAIRNGAAP